MYLQMYIKDQQNFLAKRLFKFNLKLNNVTLNTLKFIFYYVVNLCVNIKQIVMDQ